MEGGSGKGRVAAAKRLSAPRSLKATSVAWGGVTLRWAAPKGAKPKHYLVLRDGKSLGKTTRNTFTDTKVKPGTTYRYTVRALDERNRAGALSSSVRVKVPMKEVLGPPAPTPTTNASPPIATVTPTAQPDYGNPTPEPTPRPPTPTATPTHPDAHRDRRPRRPRRRRPRRRRPPTATPTATPDRDRHGHADRDRHGHADRDRHRDADRATADRDGDRRPRPPRPPRPPRRRHRDRHGDPHRTTATPTPTPPPDQLTEAMVDRLFWRAGFGPTQAQRDAWTGKKHAELVDWFLDTPSALDDSKPKPLTSAGLPIDPMVSDIELELDWIDRMQRAINPLPDRLAFFWHRHWAISRDDGIDYPWVINYRNRLLKYADFGTTPALTFRDLAYEMTTLDSAMSLYLNMNQNVRGKPNENYAREFMELFCLGPKGPDGTDNYTQDDVAGLAKAFTGWSLNGTQRRARTTGRSRSSRAATS